MVSTFGDFDLNDDSDNVHRNNDEEDQNLNLLNDILDLCRHKRKRKGWINEDYYQLLKKIFSKYPSRHGDIISRLKISKSTYWRLSKEMKEDCAPENVSRRRNRYEKRLTPYECKLVEHLLIPPKPPVTISEI